MCRQVGGTVCICRRLYLSVATLVGAESVEETVSFIGPIHQEACYLGGIKTAFN